MQIRPRDRALLAAVAAIAVLAAFYVLAIAPEHRRAKQIEGQIATAKTALTTAQSAYASGRAAQARLASSSEQYRAADRAVPAVADIPALLRLLQRSAAAVDVKIDSITPGAASTAGSTTGTATPTAGTSPTGDVATPTPTASAIPVSLTIGGGYEALSRLVRRLDTLVDDSGGHLHALGPLVGVSDVSLTPGAASGSAGSKPGASLSISLTATIYQTASPASASATPTGGSS